jgi:hypothetical protein
MMYIVAICLNNVLLPDMFDPPTSWKEAESLA